jgi:hypothetical protein
MNAARGDTRLEYRKDAAWGKSAARTSHVYAELLWKDFFRFLSASKLESVAAETQPEASKQIELRDGGAAGAEWNESLLCLQ